jgi:hypothetical protein
MTGVTGVSAATSSPGKNTTKAGVVIETMSAPNPVNDQTGLAKQPYTCTKQILFKQHLTKDCIILYSKTEISQPFGTRVPQIKNSAKLYSFSHKQ